MLSNVNIVTCEAICWSAGDTVYKLSARVYGNKIKIYNTSGTYRSKLHRDGTMFEGMFVVGIKTPAGHYPYHFPLDYWDLFEETPVKSFTPTYDGHKPESISRLFSL